MLHITPETLAILRHAQAAAEGRERARRMVAVHAVGRKLDHKRFNKLVDSVSLILRAGSPTQFEYEGACRHGVRVSLIRQSWSWADADANAMEVVQSALLAVGAKRPTWNEGQGEFAIGSMIERHSCARCGGRIDDERKKCGRAKYCSDLCAAAAGSDRHRRNDDRVTLAERLAELALKRREAIEEHSGTCEVCEAAFLAARPGRKFCSIKCRQVGRIARNTKPCQACGKPFKPRLAGHVETRFCSNSCSALARRKPAAEQPCKQCGMQFTAPSRHTYSYCSISCASAAKKKDRPEASCPTCKSVFHWRLPSKKQIYCRAACNPRDKNYPYRSNLKCDPV